MKVPFSFSSNSRRLRLCASGREYFFIYCFSGATNKAAHVDRARACVHNLLHSTPDASQRTQAREEREREADSEGKISLFNIKRSPHNYSHFGVFGTKNFFPRISFQYGKIKILLRSLYVNESSIHVELATAVR